MIQNFLEKSLFSVLTNVQIVLQIKEDRQDAYSEKFRLLHCCSTTNCHRSYFFSWCAFDECRLIYYLLLWQLILNQNRKYDSGVQLWCQRNLIVNITVVNNLGEIGLLCPRTVLYLQRANSCDSEHVRTVHNFARGSVRTVRALL